MKKLILLLLVFGSALLNLTEVNAQVNGVYTVSPLTVVDSAGQKFATLGYVKNWFSGKKYAYWKSDEFGDLTDFGGYYLKGTRQNSITNTNNNIPYLWTSFESPCSISDGDVLAYWNATGNALQAQLFGDSLWVTQTISESNPHEFVLRGKNMLLRTDLTELDSSAILAKCYGKLAGGETGFGGLLSPTSFTTPPGYVT